ncbi:MAG TPA: hypothetical protein VGK22_18610 [Candidatus Angelobacter sp.]|jgi:hypothetical protein
MKHATVSALIGSSKTHLQTTIFNAMRRYLAVALTLALAENAMFAQAVQTPPQMQQQAPGTPTSAFTLPAGTKLPLGLLRPLSVKHANPGTDVYLQVTFPVTAGSQVLIPPGSYLQGVIGKIIRRDRGRAMLEFELRSANLIFSNGYTVALTGAVSVSPTTAELYQPAYSNGQPVPAMAAVGGATPPTLPTPSLGNGPRDAAIGLGVAGAVGTVALILLARRSDVQMETGTPMEIILPAPLPLDSVRVLAALQQYNQQATNAPPEIVQPPKKPTMCYDSGSPGTPDTVIPGNPGTPPTVIPGMNGAPDTVIPGIPARPDTVIPGTPATPASSYECGK